MEAFLTDLWSKVWANISPILVFAAALATAVVAWRTSSLKAKVDRMMLSVEDRKASNDKVRAGAEHGRVELEADKLAFERDQALNERMDRLVAHLERQAEQARQDRDRATKMNEELGRKIDAQTTEIRTLRARVNALVVFIRGKGLEPPPEDAPPTH